MTVHMSSGDWGDQNHSFDPWSWSYRLLILRTDLAFSECRVRFLNS